MKTKNLAISAIILVILVGIIVLTNVMSNRRPSSQARQFFPELSESTITAFQVIEKDKGVKVFKQGDVWKAVQLVSHKETPAETSDSATASPVAGIDAGSADEYVEQGRAYPADSAAVATALEKIASMERDILVSQNPEKQDVFEVGKDKGRLVQVFGEDGKKTGSFMVGKNATDFSSHYVREVGSNKVYSVAGSIRYSLFSEFDRWRDKTILDFDKSLARIVTVKKQGETFTVERMTDTTGAVQWKLTSPIKANANNEPIDEIIGKLANLKAADWEEDSLKEAEGLGFTNPEVVVTVTMQNGDEKKLIVGKKKEGTSQFWVTVPERDDVFLMSDYAVKPLDTSVDALKAPETAESAS